jgi:hypothetical protein
MIGQASLLVLVGIGIVSGLTAGVFGLGGGILIVPGLMYLAGFSQARATGTSLAVLLPPVGLAATLEYYRHGNVDLRAAFVIAACLFVGGGLGALLANRLGGPYLRLAFGVLVIALGVSLVYDALRRIA